MSDLFREKSLKKLSSPEELDKVFKITSPLSWVILGTLLVLLVSAIIWGIFGSIATQVDGQGILISRGQKIYDANAFTAGSVEAVFVRVGDEVKKDQLVAKLTLPLLAHQIQIKKQSVTDLSQQYFDLKDFVENDEKLAKKHNEILKNSWKKDIENADKHLKYLKNAITEREKLVGVAVTSQQLADLKSQYYKEIQSRDAISHKLKEKDILTEREFERNHERLRQLNNQLQQAKRELVSLDEQMKVNSEIKSPVDGEVIEISTKVGALVQTGQKIVDIEGASEIIDAAIYVPAAQGKKIKAGMEVHIVPGTVKKQEYGSVIGTVHTVSRFPSSQSGMKAVLGNEKLVQTFLESGPQLFIRADLIEDKNTFSGFKWTSSKGPDLIISNGTLCTASITVETQAPITLVLPALRKLFGMGE